MFSSLAASFVFSDCNQELRLKIACLNFKVDENFTLKLTYPKSIMF